MSSLNQVYLLGRIGQEPKVSTSSSGTTIANMSLATSRKYQDKEEVQWHSVTAFGKAAEFAQKYIHKGDCVLVIGEIKYSKFTNQKGEERFMTNILVSNIQLCSSKAANNPPCQAAAAPAPADDDFPVF